MRSSSNDFSENIHILYFYINHKSEIPKQPHETYICDSFAINMMKWQLYSFTKFLWQREEIPKQSTVRKFTVPLFKLSSLFNHFMWPWGISNYTGPV